MFKRTLTTLLIAAAVCAGSIPAALAAPADAVAATKSTTTREACQRGAAGADCAKPAERSALLRFAIPKGTATVDCGCLGATTIGTTHSAMACASGTATTVACGGQCPQGGEAWQLVCD